MKQSYSQRFSKLKFSLLAILLVFTSLILWQCSLTSQAVSYNKDIRPIFNQKCLSCHGGVKQLGEFSLLFEEDAFNPTESGEIAIIPGNAKNSELYKRIVHHDPEERMPQDANPLTKAETDLIAKWIDQGAKWEEHWAYIPPTKSTDWEEKDIDHFIKEKLSKTGLKPTKEAEKLTLLRRLSLDLTGLPPSQKLIESFSKDNTSEAYEKAVDQLLASSHFGERWASLWLDLARYADSKGYEKDGNRDMWRYRDWVIEAFNKDLPFDQFTIEQLAGDMLPQPTVDQLIATAFHRNTMTNEEGGTDDDEYRIAAVIDRVNTTFEVWQGTTISCVQCHSHPYDPIRHEEFYQVMDIFNHTLDHDLNTEIPNLSLFTAEDETKIQETIEFIQKLEPALKIDQSSQAKNQITKALFPILIPADCDDFENMIFSGNGSVSNWAYNLQAISDNRFLMKFSDIDLTNLTHISYSYSVEGNDAKVITRLDDGEGKILHEINFPATKISRWAMNDFPTKKSPIVKSEGIHDLIFEIVNTTGKIPEGMLTIGTIELHYSGNSNHSPKTLALKKELIDLRNKGDLTPIMREKSKTFKRKTQVFEGGNWMVLGQEVKAKVPNSFLTQNAEQPKDRLAFAQWLVSKENPLTARVMVNRFWEQIFGTGIIESMEDFGTQGLEASHPELLDYLAIRFQEPHQWSVKALLKEIVLSDTYKQSSQTTPQKIEKDPYNRLLSRGPRFRLSAEQIRDQALAVSGLLNDSVGGKSVMPHQPEGVWEIVYSSQRWVTPKDNMRHRRGLYTYWKRTSPYPSMVSFDSPSREFCVSRRIRTNTPLQALITLNDPVYLEAAKALGEKMIAAGKGDLKEAIRMGYFRAINREADDGVVEILEKLYHQAEDELANSPIEKVNLKEEKSDNFKLKEPMTVVANAIMNLDGFVMKE